MKPLPYGVCRTHFFNACDRRRRRNPRPCFVAYAGHGRGYESKRFPIDTLGREEAFQRAKAWRRRRAPLGKRSCDVNRKMKD